jgi:DNA invertase Pin-like site-specific DNA recombinase
MSPVRHEAVQGDEQGEALGVLLRLGKRRDAAQRKLAAVDDEVRIAIVEAVVAGVPKLRVAGALGVARQTVYDVLAREESG